MKQLLTSYGALALGALALAAPARAADLILDVRGLGSAQGEVMVAVFGDAESWLRKPVAVARQPAAGQKDGVLSLTLKDLPPGALALSVFHDLNGNGRLDRNLMGIPQEPFAFSNDAVGQFGPPRFEQARFEPNPAGKADAAARVAVKLIGQ
ncbi:MAG: DUF2141 domain-containing protein [Burkholderiaceae bacterium]